MKHEIQVKDVLLGMKKLFSSADKWTKNTLARDTMGKVCLVNQPDAHCYCIQGGIDKTLFNLGFRNNRYNRYSQRNTIRHAVIDALVKELPVGYDRLHTFNDYPSREFTDILEVIDKAIAATI